MINPVVPPPELVEKWHQEYLDLYSSGDSISRSIYVATQAAQWGADQELEACCQWLFENDYDVAPVCLRAARRPKPPSLKEQALAVIENSAICDHLSPQDAATIRRALEQL